VDEKKKKKKREEVKSELDENFLSLKFFSRFVRKKICELRYKSQTPPTISCPIKLRIEDVPPLLLPFSIQTNIPFEVYKKDNNSAPDGSFHLIFQQKKTPIVVSFFMLTSKYPIDLIGNCKCCSHGHMFWLVSFYPFTMNR
jgi:hypothetical protein